ncbi:MAG: N-acetylmuramoyl-L-alanine amidase [Silicimonas sp.]|nr:N-acetylmuramoyl-L-alanine amidase [Silicimonas sp.]
MAAVLAVGLAVVAWAEPSGLAQLGPKGARVKDAGGTVVLSVPLSQAVPWRVALRAGPPQVVVEMGDVVWSELPVIVSDSVSEARTSRAGPGWTELALVLREPLSVATAAMKVAKDGTAVLEVRLLPTTADEFHRLADPAKVEAIAGPESDRMVVALDPGHGGIDPGAVAGDLVEADLMLAAARAMKEALVRTGRFDVALTREEDDFVSLEARLTKARAAGADVFISLHADALSAEDGSASGMTVYRLADDAAGAADALLAARHAGNDLLKGVDLSGVGDDVALALLDVARRDTAPRTKALQFLLVEAFRSSGLAVNSRPEREGAYSVLKSAEIPSVLIELGFLSSERDRARLRQKAWQGEAAQALSEALMRWQDEDRLRGRALGQ